MKLFLTALLLCLTMPTISTAQNIEVQGHRGARSVLPENTLVAFKYALELGVDTLEFDTGVSKDDVVVVIHDQKINNTICQYQDGSAIKDDLWIRELSLQQIKSIDCGSKMNPRFKQQSLQPGSQIPTLEEVFSSVTNSSHPNAAKVLFNIETKSDPKNPDAQPHPAEFAKRILALVSKFGLEDRVTIQSFDHRTLVEAKKQAPNVQISALFKNKPKDWVKAAQLANADIVSPYFKKIDASDVATMHQAGLKVIPWTANTENSWAKLISFGVDGIITDDPASLLEYLGRDL